MQHGLTTHEGRPFTTAPITLVCPQMTGRGHAIRMPHRRVNPGPQQTATVNLAGPPAGRPSLDQPERIPRCLIRMRSQVQVWQPYQPSPQLTASLSSGAAVGVAALLLTPVALCWYSRPSHQQRQTAHGQQSHAQGDGQAAAEDTYSRPRPPVQPPCGSVPTRPGSVGVTVVEGARRCSRSASGPRPNRCTRSAP